MPLLPRGGTAGTVVRLFRKGALRLDGRRVSAEAFAEYERAAFLRDRFPNAANQDRLDGALRGMAADVLANLTAIHEADIAHLAEHGGRLDLDEAGGGPSRAIALVLGMLQDEASEAELLEMAQGVARRLGKYLGGRKVALAEGPRTIVVDADMNAKLVEAALDIIREHV
jgi:hypothetical protein